MFGFDEAKEIRGSEEGTCQGGKEDWLEQSNNIIHRTIGGLVGSLHV